MTSLVFVVFAISLVQFGAVFCAEDANVESPCPSKFRYSFKSPPLGLFTITIDPDIKEADIKAVFSIPGSGEKIGRLQFLSEKLVRQKSGEMKRKLKYKIRFPDVPFLPKLTQLTVDNVLRCKGPPYMEPDFSGIEVIPREDHYIQDVDDTEDDVTTKKPSRRTTKKSKKEEEVEEGEGEEVDDEK